jgi:hypothetical protein
MCWGAFTALQQSLVYSGSDGKPLLGVCAPAEGTRLQLVQVFSSYARQHPEKHHYEFMDMALIALSVAFPLMLAVLAAITLKCLPLPGAEG